MIRKCLFGVYETVEVCGNVCEVGLECLEKCPYSFTVDMKEDCFQRFERACDTEYGRIKE